MATAATRGAAKHKKLVLIGCGAVGCAVLELLPLSALVPAAVWARILIIEPRELTREMEALRPRLREVEHWRIALTRGNLESTLDRALGRGDTVVDASVNVDALALMAFCSARGCIYVNTSMENWEVPHPEKLDPRPTALYERSLYARVLEAKRRFPPGGPSMLADHGMNPGLISHFAQRGLEDAAKKLGDSTALALLRGGSPQGAAKAAERLGLRVLHIAEKDTQQPKRARPPKHFYNTWSAVGLIAEALDPVQLGLGTHEDASAVVAPNAGLPGGRYVAPPLGPKNVRFLPIRGMDLRLASFCPGRQGRGSRITGYAIPHGESNTISALLTRGPGSETEHARAAMMYRPSVYYVYQVAACARASLERLRKGGHSPAAMPAKHVLRLPEIRKGYDAVGALLLFDETPANPRRGVREWWCGTILSTDDVKRYGFLHSGPTVVQVAIAIVSALRWLLANPARGFLTPEDLPFAAVLRDAIPFLGRIFSGPVTSGLGRRRQFSDFIVRSGSGRGSQRPRKSEPSADRGGHRSGTAGRSRTKTGHRSASRTKTGHRSASRTKTGHRTLRPSRAKSSERRRSPGSREKRRGPTR
jgi:homospermidine synthase